MYKFIITEEGGQFVGEFTRESASTEFLRDLITDAEESGSWTEESGSWTEEDPEGHEVTATIIYDKEVFETEIRDAVRMSTEYEGSNAKVFAPPCLWGEFIEICKTIASEKALMSTEYEGSNATVFAPPCLWGEFIEICKTIASEKNLKVGYAKTEDEVDIWAWGPDDGEDGTTWRIRAIRG
jgi:hypothetical protein